MCFKELAENDRETEASNLKRVAGNKGETFFVILGSSCKVRLLLHISLTLAVALQLLPWLTLPVRV